MHSPFHPSVADPPTIFPHSTVTTNPASPHLLILAMLMTFSLVNSSPLPSDLESGVNYVDQKTIFVPSFEMDKRNNFSDPRRIMCGYQLIVNLKMQCGDRGTYSPYERGPRIKRGLRLGRPAPLYSPLKSRGRKHDDFCSIYLRYEPYTIVTECCCRGCTRRFLEQHLYRSRLIPLCKKPCRLIGQITLHLKLNKSIKIWCGFLQNSNFYQPKGAVRQLLHFQESEVMLPNFTRFEGCVCIQKAVNFELEYASEFGEEVFNFTWSIS
ncbi:Insulin IGF relaxin [Echinococcus multilocularis]|uniref:Insulin IGF relaxin n=1 Tax=Echinococcus multilocularis TaxID=6211 RepID=A0A087VX60_ECHMU|nr:Insulin IGF relaxin [Echinococcus multilocularis]